MTAVVFYQKPGCATNGRQIRALEAAGHNVDAKDLLKAPWTAEALRSFFGETPVASWFNRAAPRIKSGEINPETCDAADALALMLAEPLLIRRPLVEANGRRCAGFDREPVLTLLGQNEPQGLEGCSREETGTHCPAPAGILD
jgi:nitrogenase-associated protein